MNKGCIVILTTKKLVFKKLIISKGIVAAIINPFIGKAADISVQFAFSTCALIATFGYGFFLIYKRKDQNTNSFFTK